VSDVSLSLKKNVIAEPSVAGWYAWSYLLPPQTLAKYLKNHYLNIVESYLANPETHRTALKQSRFQGGPFVHEQDGSYEKIEAWYRDARERYAPLLALGDAIDELEQEILPQQTGASMDEVYRNLPEPLAGRVELFYNRDNRTPDYRFIEPLVYQSEYFDPGLQQVRFSEIHADARQFALTTPVLEYTPEQVLVTVPLDSDLLDTVFRGGLTPAELDRITGSLGIDGERAEVFKGLFTEDQEPPPAATDDVIEYVGHACVFVRHQGTTFLVDPVISYSGYSREADGRFTFDDLPARIDYVMITHNHQDHMLLETLLKIRHRVGTVVIAKSANSSLVDPDLKRILGVLGFRDVVELGDRHAGRRRHRAAVPRRARRHPDAHQVRLAARPARHQGVVRRRLHQRLAAAVPAGDRRGRQGGHGLHRDGERRRAGQLALRTAVPREAGTQGRPRQAAQGVELRAGGRHRRRAAGRLGLRDGPGAVARRGDVRRVRRDAPRDDRQRQARRVRHGAGRGRQAAVPARVDSGAAVTAKQHVVHVGFHATEAHAIDFDRDTVTAVMPRASAARLPEDLAARFARIAVVDLPDTDDLELYDRAADEMCARAVELAAEFGTPAAIVGLYEHTTLPAARMREHFGLSGTDVRTATLCRDKVPMKQVLADAGVPVPRFIALGADTPRSELAEFAARVPGRIVVKPRSQGASIGVRILDDAAALLALAASGGFEEGTEAEEFVSGTIYHFDGIVRDGEIQWFSAARYLDSCFSFQYEDVPLASVTLDDPGLVLRSWEFTDTVLRAIGLTDSAFHLEAFHTEADELVFLEIGNRFGGAGVPWLQRAIFGVDLAREAVLACLGRPTELPAPATVLDHAGAAGWLYMPLTEKGPCRVTEITGVDTLPASVVLRATPAVGSELNGRADTWPTAGRFLLLGDTAIEVEQDMAKIADSYSITTTSTATGG
jgi:hypothetical protein